MITKAKFVFGISSRTGSSKRECMLFSPKLYPKRRSYHISSSFVLFFQAVKIMKLIKFKTSP